MEPGASWTSSSIDTETGQLSSSCLLQNNNNDSVYKRYPKPLVPSWWPVLRSPFLKGKVSDSKVTSQEGTVPGRCEGQVGTCILVQNIEGVRQFAGVKALICHPNLLLFEGLRGGQRLLGREEGCFQRELEETEFALLAQESCLFRARYEGGDIVHSQGEVATEKREPGLKRAGPSRLGGTTVLL